MDRLWSRRMAISRIYILRRYNKSCEWSATSPCNHCGELCLCVLPGFLLHKWFGRPIPFRCGGSPWWHESDWYAYYQPAASSAGDFTEPALPSGSFSTPGPRATPPFANQQDTNHGNYEGLS